MVTPRATQVLAGLVPGSMRNPPTEDGQAPAPPKVAPGIWPLARPVTQLPPLPEEDGAGAVELDRDGDEGEDGRKDDKGGAGDRHVHRPLQRLRGTRELQRGNREERDALERVDLRARADEVEESGHDVDLHVRVVQRAHELDRLLRRIVREGHDDALDVQALHDLGDLIDALDVNPLIVGEKGCVAVDAMVELSTIRHQKSDR